MERMFSPDLAEFTPHNSTSTAIEHQNSFSPSLQSGNNNNNNHHGNNSNHQSELSLHLNSPAENQLLGLSSTDSDFQLMNEESSYRPRGPTIASHVHKNNSENKSNSVVDDDDDDEEPMATRKKKILSDYDKQRVRLSNVIQMLAIDCDKMRHFAFLPFYFLMLISIFILLLLHRADTLRAKSTIHFPDVITQITNETTITALETSNDARNPFIFFNAVNVMLKNLLDTYVASSEGLLWVLPLAILRQIRVQDVECWTGSAFFTAPSDNDPTTNDCPGTWDDASNARDYSIYRKNYNGQIALNSVATPTNDFNTPSAEFVTTLRLWNSTVFDQDVNRTVNYTYIDSNTRGLMYNVVFSFPDSGTILIFSIYWATTDGGLVMIRTKKETVNLFSLNRGFMSMDSVVMILAVFLLTITILEVYDNWGRIDGESWKSVTITSWPRFFFSIVSPWQIVTFLTLLIILTVSVLRFQMWQAAARWIDGVPQVADPSLDSLLNSYQDAVTASENYLRTYELYGYAFMLMTYRFGYAAQHLSKLSLIARTFRTAIGDLLRVFNVFAVSMLVFSMIFHAVFGQMLSSMRTLSRTAIVLARMIISGDADPGDYLAMRKSSFAIEADILLTAFFVLFWLLLLNFVLAIISSAFMNSYMEVRSADTIVNVLQTYILFNAPMYYVDRFHRPDDLQNMGAGRRAAAAALSVPPSYYTRLRLLLMIWRWRVSSLNTLNALQRTIDRDRMDPTVSRHELPTLMPPPDLRNSLTLFKNMKRLFKFGSGDKANAGLANTGASPSSPSTLQQGASNNNNNSNNNNSNNSNVFPSSPHMLRDDTWDSSSLAISRSGATSTPTTTNMAIEMNSVGNRSNHENTPNSPTSASGPKFRDEKKISRSRASEAGLRAVAFLVNELFDAVHVREIAEAKMTLDTHTRAMKKLSRATNRIKYIASAVSALDAALRKGPASSLGSFNVGGSSSSSSGVQANPSAGNVAGRTSGLLRRVSQLSQIANAFNARVTPPGSLGTISFPGSTNSLKQTSQQASDFQPNASSAGRRRGSQDSSTTSSSQQHLLNNNNNNNNNNHNNKKVSFKNDLEDPRSNNNNNNNNNNHFRMSDSGNHDPASFASVPSGAFQSSHFPPSMMDVARAAVRDAGNNNYNNNTNNNNNNNNTSNSSSPGRNEGRAPPPSHQGRSSIASLFGGTGLIYNPASDAGFGVSNNNNHDGNFYHDGGVDNRHSQDDEDDVERLMSRIDDSEARMRQQQRMNEALGML